MDNRRTQGVLSGLRVLDLSRMLSGPYCTMMLADHGAEVIKIESKNGDTSRSNGPFRDDDPNKEWAGYFVSLNRSKKSVQLDLKSEEGKQSFLELCKTADVVVENFRPGVMERLGLSYETLAEINPRLVYAAIRGFGDPRSGESPYQNWPSYDVVAQAMGGIMGLTGPDANSPTKVGPGIGDIFTGMMMSFGIMAALRQVDTTGRGQFVDVAMYDAMMSLCERAIYQYDFDGTIPGPQGNGHPLLALFGLFPAKDGQVALGIVDDSFWRALTGVMNMQDLRDDARFASIGARSANSKVLNAIVAEWTTQFSKAELKDLLGGVVPFGPLNSIQDIFADPQVSARGMLTEVAHPVEGAKPWTVAANPVHFSNAPTPAALTPPRLGGDNDTYLKPSEARCYSKEEQRDLRNAFGTFATGVTIVTTVAEDGTPRGFTANSFTSVSLDPPLVLVCIGKFSESIDVFETSKGFTVNILSEDQKETAGIFAAPRADKFEHVGWRTGSVGMPIIEGSLSQFECTRERVIDAGDHIILIGKVQEYAYEIGQPLGYANGGFFSLEGGRTLLNAAKYNTGTVVGAVLENDGKILFYGDKTAPTITLPSSNMFGIEATPAALTEKLKNCKLDVSLDFLLSAYDDTASGKFMIYYRGKTNRKVPEGMHFHPIEDLPFERIEDEATRFMLRRYMDEAKQGRFSIYHGDEASGETRTVDPTPEVSHV